ncbi:MAG TPA: AtpZ/AtpI family protein [Acidimicrobiales bacterium]|nr:AtpZ/AtpI family protein [Acidimicrobiales bacterium]
MSRRPPGILEFAQLGMIGAVCLLGGGALGWFVDSETGTLPLFLFVGLLAGAVLGAVMTWREVKKSM